MSGPSRPKFRAWNNRVVDGMIEIKDLYKSFDGRQIYQGLNLSISDQKITVILGKSGVGKSVLLKHILGLILPDSGHIDIEGIDITGLSEPARRRLRLKFGMVFQHSALFDSLTVEENVGLGLRKLTGYSEQEIRERVSECLQAVGMEQSVTLLPEKLSGGMSKRVAFARAVALNPPYLLYDEPTIGLDPTTSQNISDLILEFNRTFQTTSIIVTHDVMTALKIADRIVIMSEGKIQADHSPQTFTESDDPLVRSFLGTTMVPVK